MERRQERNLTTIKSQRYDQRRSTPDFFSRALDVLIVVQCRGEPQKFHGTSFGSALS